MREEAAKYPTVVYVDAYKLFSVNGEFSTDITDTKGNRIEMRTGDGVHLTVAGAQYLAEHVYQLIDSRWNLSTQAAPLTPIEYTIEPAFGDAGGVHITRGNGEGESQNTTPATTSPTTAAPVTTVPRTTVPTTIAKPPPTTSPTTQPGGGGPSTTAPPKH
jgi:hypothetical protein